MTIYRFWPQDMTRIYKSDIKAGMVVFVQTVEPILWFKLLVRKTKKGLQLVDDDGEVKALKSFRRKLWV